MRCAACRSSKIRIVVAALGMSAVGGRAARAQESTLAGRCYQFNNAYFSATARFANRPDYVVSTTVVRLATELPRFDPPIRRYGTSAPIVPEPFDVDPATRENYLSMSGWRMLGADSVGIDWSNGYLVSRFRVAVWGDSLAGFYVKTSDAVGSIPPTHHPVAAVRVACGNEHWLRR